MTDEQNIRFMKKVAHKNTKIKEKNNDNIQTDDQFIIITHLDNHSNGAAVVGKPKQCFMKSFNKIIFLKCSFIYLANRC